MIKVAICSNLDTAKIVGQYINSCFMEKVIYSVTSFFAGEETVLSSEFNFDIIFAEVDLSCSKGLETVKRIRKIAPLGILFVITDKNASVLPEADKLGIFHILQKPLDEEIFSREILNAVKVYEKTNARLMVKVNGNILNLSIQSIMFITVHMKRVEIVTVGGRISFNGAINKYSEKLSGKGFAHCHKSFLVNLNYVKIIGANELKLDGCNDIIPVSRGYRANFIKQYEEYFADRTL